MDLDSNLVFDLCVADERGRHVIIAKAGEMLLSALQSNGIHIGAVCGGNMVCGTCHVFIEPGSHDLESSAPEELGLLAMSAHYRPGRSRLACQLRIDASLQNRCIEVAPDD